MEPNRAIRYESFKPPTLALLSKYTMSIRHINSISLHTFCIDIDDIMNDRDDEAASKSAPAGGAGSAAGSKSAGAGGKAAGAKKTTTVRGKVSVVFVRNWL